MEEHVLFLVVGDQGYLGSFSFQFCSRILLIKLSIEFHVE